MKSFNMPERLNRFQKSILLILLIIVFIFIYEIILSFAKAIDSDSFTAFLLILLLIMYVPLFQKAYQFYKVKKLYSREKARIANGLISLDEIHHLTPHEFEIWVSKFLTLMDYSDIQITDLGPDGGKDIICKKGNDTVYVECKRYVYNETGNVKFIVDKQIVEKLIGAMVGNNVNTGLIITTGMVTQEASEFACSIDDSITLQIIDGPEIVSIYNTYNAEKEDKSKLSLSFN